MSVHFPTAGLFCLTRLVRFLSVSTVLFGLLPTAFASAQDSRVEEEFLTFLPVLADTVFKRGGEEKRILIDLHSISMVAQSLTRRPISDDSLRAAIGIPFEDVFWEAAFRLPPDSGSTRRTVHLRLDGLSKVGSQYTVMITTIRWTREHVDMSSDLLVFMRRGSRWDLIGRTNLGIT